MIAITDSESPTIAPGQELLGGRLRVRDVLGVGSAGVVYLADDRRLGRQVALKTLRNFDADRLYQLKREFRTLAKLSHANLVQLYELGAAGDVWFLIMELVDGVELSQWIKKGPGLQRLLRTFGELFEGLRVLHAAGYTHGDVKPSNVMVTRDDRAVLLDFGLASPIRSTARTTAAGTLDYIAPEQLLNEAPGTSADWYSFGVVLFEALTGELPFASAERLKNIRRAPRHRPGHFVPNLPLALDEMVTRLLDPDPSRRPDAVELALALRAPSTRPRMAIAVPESAFVGRPALLSRLEGFLEETRRGKSAIVHLRGPSGIGKTALVRHFIAGVRSKGEALALEGACHLQESVPYRAFDALVDNLARHLMEMDDRVVISLAPRHAASLLHLFPVLGRVPGVRQWPSGLTPGAPTEMRRHGFDALRELLGKLADQQPVVLWIDDIQWSDRDSRPLLQALLAPPDAPRLLVLLSSRTHSGGTPLIDDIGDSLTINDVALDPLSPAESRELTRDLASDGGTELDVDAVVRDSGGSPFLLGELVRYLRESPAGDHANRPVNIATLIQTRLTQLSAEARRLLEVVAIAGGPLENSLAFEVAAVGRRGQLLAHDLCVASLLRMSVQNEREYLETYHDRIREIAIGCLDAGERIARHHDLAVGIRGGRTPDPRALVKHYVAAGEHAEAARFALLAAEAAEHDLALDQAAELYNMVLELRPDARRDGSILKRRAAVLASAARRTEAAIAYAEAARVIGDDGREEERTALYGQAAEQFFYGGELRKGVTLLQGVLRDVGVRVPAGTPARAILGQGLRLRFMVQRFRLTRQAPQESIDPRVRARLDALWRAIRGTVMLDHILADVLAGKHLLEALRAGDPSRALRAVSLEAAFEANIGGRWLSGRSRRLLLEAEHAAGETGDRYDQAWVAHCRAACAWFDGRWQDCLRLGAGAEAQLKAIGMSASWDVAVLRGFMLSALANMGRLRELTSRLTILISDAERRQDNYALRVFRTGDAVITWLVNDQVDTALQVADQTLGDYQIDQFTSQHRHHLVATVQIHLYAGDGVQAWQRIVTAWRPVGWSGFLLLDCLGTQLRYLRACSALALARTPSHAARTISALLHVCRKEMRRIRRSELPMASPMAAAIEAGIAGAEGRREAQAAALRAACEGFDAADMALHREATRWHLAALVPGGARIRAESEEWMRSEGVVCPAFLARAVVPPA